MNELQKIIEGFKKAEEACRELCKDYHPGVRSQYYLGRANAYKEVVEVLEDFMSKHSVFVLSLKEPLKTMDEGMEALARDLEEERSN